MYLANHSSHFTKQACLILVTQLYDKEDNIKEHGIAITSITTTVTATENLNDIKKHQHKQKVSMKSLEVVNERAD